MIENVRIRVQSLQAGPEGIMEVDTDNVWPGSMLRSEDSMNIRYEEVDPDSGSRMRCLVRIGDDWMKVRRRGDVQSGMHFDAARITETEYVTPWGRLPFQIETLLLEQTEDETGYGVRVCYRLSAGSGPLPDRELRIRVESGT